MSNLTIRQRSTASEANVAELRAAPTCVKNDGRLPSNPPRVPRRSAVRLTNLQVALCLLGSIAVIGGLYGAALEVLSLMRLVGWMLWRPAP